MRPKFVLTILFKILSSYNITNAKIKFISLQIEIYHVIEFKGLGLGKNASKTFDLIAFTSFFIVKPLLINAIYNLNIKRTQIFRHNHSLLKQISKII